MTDEHLSVALAGSARRRIGAAVSPALLTLGVLAGCGGAGPESGTEAAERTSLQERNERIVREAFTRDVAGPDSFYSILAPDVSWVVAGATPSRYTSREEFLTRGSSPIVDRLSTPIRPTIRDLYTDGDTVVAVWDGEATARDGRPYHNSYAWIMTLRDDQVSRVIAFLDHRAIEDLTRRVP